MGTGRQAYHKARHARREEKKSKERKKKRCGFIMFVIESTAAVCGIPDSILSQLQTRQKT